MRFYTIIFLFILAFSTQISAQVAFDITRTDADNGTEVQIEFKVDNFTDLIGYTIPVRWDKDVIQLLGVSSVASLPGLMATQDNFGITEGMNTGSMICNWESLGANPRTLPNGTALFTLNFQVIGSPGQSSVIEIFDDINNNPVFIDSDINEIPFTQMAGEVNVTGETSGLFIFAEDVVGAPGSLTCVDIKVNGFTNVGGFQFAVTWDPDFMQLEDVNSNLNVNSMTNNDDGVVLISFDTQTGVTLPSGSDLMELCFRITGTSGSTDVVITDLPDEFFDMLFSTPDGTSIPFTKQNGSVSIDGEPECIPDGFTFVFDAVTVQPGEVFCYPIKVANFDDILLAQFCLEWDPSVLRFIETSGFTLLGIGENNFNLINEGTLAAVWDSPTAQPISVDDFSAIFNVCFEVIGEAGEDTGLSLGSSCIEGGVLIETGDGTIITDPFECSGTISVSDDVPIVVTVDQIANVSCPGQMDGGIAIDVTGGTPDYTYVWTRVGSTSPVGTNRNLTGVGTGQYNVLVTDSDGKTLSAGPFTISSDFSITVNEDILAPLCAGDNNGSITINVSGNTGTITNIAWTPGPSGPDQFSIDNISAGTYNLRISYGEGCAFERNITVADGSGPSINATVDAEAGSITLAVTGGAGGNEFLWSDNNMNQNRTGLSAGTYSVTVTDLNGCEAIGGPYTITGGGENNVELQVEDYNGFGVSCNGVCDGRITANPLFGSAPFTYNWSSGASSSSLTGLCSGIYTVTVTDAMSNTGTATVTLTAPTRLRVEVEDFMQSTVDNGSATVSAEGGLGPYSFVWNDPQSTAGPSIANQPAEMRIVTVTDQNGCTANRTINFAMSISDDCYDHRKVITPNGDGLNDELRFTCLDGTTNQLDIFDRYGKQVFSARNYTNDWMGTGNGGEALPDGPYFFVLKVSEDVGVETVVKNSFNILKDAR